MATTKGRGMDEKTTTEETVEKTTTAAPEKTTTEETVEQETVEVEKTTTEETKPAEQ